MLYVCFFEKEKQKNEKLISLFLCFLKTKDGLMGAWLSDIIITWNTTHYLTRIVFFVQVVGYIVIGMLISIIVPMIDWLAHLVQTTNNPDENLNSSDFIFFLILGRINLRNFIGNLFVCRSSK